MQTLEHHYPMLQVVDIELRFESPQVQSFCRRMTEGKEDSDILVSGQLSGINIVELHGANCTWFCSLILQGGGHKEENLETKRQITCLSGEDHSSWANEEWSKII